MDPSSKRSSTVAFIASAFDCILRRSSGVRLLLVPFLMSSTATSSPAAYATSAPPSSMVVARNCVSIALRASAYRVASGGGSRRCAPGCCRLLVFRSSLLHHRGPSGGASSVVPLARPGVIVRRIVRSRWPAHPVAALGPVAGRSRWLIRMWSVRSGPRLAARVNVDEFAGLKSGGGVVPLDLRMQAARKAAPIPDVVEEGDFRGQADGIRRDRQLNHALLLVLLPCASIQVPGPRHAWACQSVGSRMPASGSLPWSSRYSRRRSSILAGMA